MTRWYICFNDSSGARLAAGPYGNVDMGVINVELRSLGATFVWLSDVVPPGYLLLSNEKLDDGVAVDALAHACEWAAGAP